MHCNVRPFRTRPRDGVVTAVVAVVAAAGSLPAPGGAAHAQALRPTQAQAQADLLQGYDFGHVVEKLSTSIDPLQKEMGGSFSTFVQAVDEAEQLLGQGETRQALAKCSAAVEAVLAARQEVLTPMWEGQTYLTEQIGWVRMRLARALEHEQRQALKTPDARTEQMLDAIARRIPGETDPVRKKWLIAHYRTVRDLAKIRQMTEQLSPDQRILWTNVLSVLDEASLAHQQVLMGSELLFAQFDATGKRLKEYLTLLDTVKGASDLLAMVRGMSDASGEMGQFASSMTELQQRLGGFNEAVEGELQQSVLELESAIDSIQPEMSVDGDAAGVVSTQQDAELAERIERLESQD
jgi:hypothetical protein